MAGLGNLSSTVEDKDGKPLAGVTVTLAGQDTQVDIVVQEQDSAAAPPPEKAGGVEAQSGIGGKKQ